MRDQLKDLAQGQTRTRLGLGPGLGLGFGYVISTPTLTSCSYSHTQPNILLPTPPLPPTPLFLHPSYLLPWGSAHLCLSHAACWSLVSPVALKCTWVHCHPEFACNPAAGAVPVTPVWPAGCDVLTATPGRPSSSVALL